LMQHSTSLQQTESGLTSSALQSPLHDEDARCRRPIEAINNDGGGVNMDTHMVNTDNPVQAKLLSDSLSTDIHAQAYLYQWL
jgi:hypothetical protein